MKEIWKNIKDYEDYQVSNFGNIKSLKRGKERIIVTSLDNGGYSVITLYKNNVRKTLKVHRIVCETFIDNPEKKPCVNHIDSNRCNNIVSNLEWVSFKENMTHAYKFGNADGSKFRGEGHGNNKYSEDTIRNVKVDLNSGCSVTDVSKKYDVPFKHVSNIKRGIIWQWL